MSKKSAKDIFIDLKKTVEIAEEKKSHKYATDLALLEGLTLKEGSDSLSIDDEYKLIDQSGFTVLLTYHMHDTSKPFSIAPDVNKLHLSLTDPNGKIIDQCGAVYYD